ncbi:hypothetical protein BU26DRAFT_522595 [Trematosphaeria pertusa]|uniref:peptidylprolyl isomerase n=1 Tax=Trematosphaeria pertusa TaxID=390896 RepID=A0A6A6I3U9_9PLEO|nr:uncharacterized protein BU26DRAFT_522595 [Trematosphaeria pertusa]KAF2244859.1 hypothetical protein BU26DRAFT_522595 [Trematosphaeria pertusa]
MASIIPAGVYGLRVPAGGRPIPASMDPSVAFRITMAAIDPTAEAQVDDTYKVARATLKLIRVPDDEDDDDDDYDPDDVEAIRARLREEGVLGSSSSSDMSEDDDDSDEEMNGGPSDPAKSKKAKQEALKKKIQEEMEDEEMLGLTNGVNGKGKAKALNGDISSDEEEDDEDDDEDDDEVSELVVCTLDPEKHYQQPLEITVREGEQIFFSSNGTHDIYLTGNFVAIDEHDHDHDDDEDEYGMGGLDYDMSSDEDELDDISESEDDKLDGLQDPRITEVQSDEEDAPKLVKTEKKGKNKRPADSEDEEEEEATTLDELISKTKAEAATNGEQKLSKKQAKKLKNNEGQAVAAAKEPAKKDSAKEKAETPGSDKKKVQFAKNLEQGPTGSPKVEEPKKETPKGPRNVNGVVIDDKKDGRGRAAKKGDRVEMRYIGKLKNGKQFDANKKGKPFSFKLGVGEVIKGWDIGVVGMMAGSERRLTIPAKLAYGNKAQPGIPANSELVFDIKCISVS